MGLTRHRVRQLKKPRAESGWRDPEKQAEFFAYLARSCNVRASARHVRLHPSNAYRMKKSCALFRSRWLAAIDAAREHMWELLHRVAIARLDPPPPERGAVPVAPDPSLALALFKLHDPERRRVNGRKAKRRTPMTDDELRALIFEETAGKAARAACP